MPNLLKIPDMRNSDDSYEVSDAGSDVTTDQRLARVSASYPQCLKIAHINAQSLPAHFDEFYELFLNSRFDLICMSESWLKPSLDSNNYVLPGYNLFRTDRVGRGGGGVAVYARVDLNVRKLLEHSVLGRPEYMFLEVKCAGSKLLLGVCYRPPKIGYLSLFENSLLELLPEYGHVVIAGDYNTDLLNNRDSYDRTYLQDMLSSCNLTLLPLQATHHTGDSHTLIDLIAVGDPDLVSTVGQFPVPGISAHDLIYVAYNLSVPSYQPQVLSYRDYKRINLEKLFSDAAEMPWSCVELMVSVDEMVSTFTGMVLSLYDKHAPVRTIRIKRLPAPWITDEIRKMMRERDSLRRRFIKTGDELLRNRYRRLRNGVNQSLRNSKIKYSHTIINNAKNPSQL